MYGHQRFATRFFAELPSPFTRNPLFICCIYFGVANASFHVIGERRAFTDYYQKISYYHRALYLFLHCAYLAGLTYKAAFFNDD